jgi:hypothetical protein
MFKHLLLLTGSSQTSKNCLFAYPWEPLRLLMCRFSAEGGLESAYKIGQRDWAKIKGLLLFDSKCTYFFDLVGPKGIHNFASTLLQSQAIKRREII